MDRDKDRERDLEQTESLLEKQRAAASGAKGEAQEPEQDRQRVLGHRRALRRAGPDRNRLSAST